MAVTSPPTTRAPRTVPTWQLGVLFWAVIAAVYALRHSGVADVPAVATFGLVFASIAVEALPFVLLGAVVSAAVAAFVPDRVFDRIGRLPRRWQVPGAAVCAVAFPVCECGSVPVGRRLIARGVHPAAGLSFMLAAPVANPIVLASTWFAYGGGRRGAAMMLGRAGLGVAAAVLSALAITRRGEDVLRARPAEHGHDHRHASRASAFAEHLAGDFLFMGRFLVLGAAVSALLQTVVPQTIAGGVAGVPVLGALVAIGLAFMLSLCSEADAFVAASLTVFPLSAQLAFLAFGPLADTKLAVLYAATFRRGFLRRLLIVAVPVCALGATAIGVLL